MKSYKKSHFVDSLILHFLVALTCSVVCSYPLWGPSLSSSMKHFFLISLPYMWSYVFNPKCLFVVVNVIVIFLVKESNLISTSSSIEGEIYNEYVERSRSLRRVSTPRQTRDQIKPVEVELKEESKVENNKAFEEEKEIEEIVEDYKEALEEDEKVEGNDVDVKEDEKIVEEEEKVELAPEIVEEKSEKGKEKMEEEVGILPAEELNKRVEAFIARVNKQRWIEANSVVCY